MTKTTNYQLNQWAKTDRILMDDFNADNLKLDKALQAETTARKNAISAEASARASGISTLNARITTEKNALSGAVSAETAARESAITTLDAKLTAANQMVRLVDVTTAAGASNIDIPLDGIDWAAYGEVLLYLRFRAVNSVGNVTLRLDGEDGEDAYHIRDYSGHNGQNCFYRFPLCPRENGASARIPYTRLGFAAEWLDASENDDVCREPLSRITYCRTKKLRSEFRVLNIQCNAVLQPGCRVVMQGVRL